MGTKAIDNANLEDVFLSPQSTSMIDSIRQNSNTKLRAVRVGLIAADALMIALSFWIAYNVRFIASTAAFFDLRGTTASHF